MTNYKKNNISDGSGLYPEPKHLNFKIKINQLIGHWSLGNWSFPKGFTLVELIVSVAITGILMLGISIFFSSTFQNMFRAQTENANIERQFAVNEIIRNKFLNLKKIVSEIKDSQSKTVGLVFMNEGEKNELPFSYIGYIGVNETNSTKHLVMKDFVPFNKMAVIDSTNYFANSGEGKIVKINATVNMPPADYNFSSFAKVDDNYYLVNPFENSVKKCPKDATGTYSNCTTLLNQYQFLQPTDIVFAPEISGANPAIPDRLFISDSSNGKIIKVNLDNSGNATPNESVATGLKYPTGLAYYKDGNDKEWLFVAETLNHQVKKIDLSNPNTITVIAGAGDDENCDKISARFCKLKLPTGLYAGPDATVPAKTILLIADSGNDRILRVEDPGIPTTLNLEFVVPENYALDKIEIKNDKWNNAGNLDFTNNNTNLIGNASHYTDKVFRNAERLTTFSGGGCINGNQALYTDEPPPAYLKVGDKLKIDSTIFTVKALPSADTNCETNPLNPPIMKWKIEVNENATGVASGLTVYFANPQEIKMKINNINFNPGASGYQTFTIDVYDIARGKVATVYQTVRVGDGILGTEEDVISKEVCKSGCTYNYTDISFPTGLTNDYFANSGKFYSPTDAKGIYDFNGTLKTGLNTMGVGKMSNFDYVSDFDLADTAPLEFEKYNPVNGKEKILEMTLRAKVNDTAVQTYKLEAVIP